MALQQALASIMKLKEQQPKLSGYKPRLSPVESEPQGNSLNTLGAILDMIARNATPAPTADGGMNAPMVPTGAYTPPQAPRLNTSGSDSMFASGNAALGNAMNAPQISAPTNPNTESILLALAPALFGAGTSYLPGLAGGYLQGQERGQAQKEAQRQEQIKRDVMLAQGTLDNAERERTKEIGIFNQENQTFRNDQDNLRMEQNAERTNQRMLAIQNQKNVLDQEKELRDEMQFGIKWLYDSKAKYESTYGGMDEDAKKQFEEAVGQVVAEANRKAAAKGLEVTFTPDFVLSGVKSLMPKEGAKTLPQQKMDNDMTKFLQTQEFKALESDKKVDMFNKRLEQDWKKFEQVMGFKGTQEQFKQWYQKQVLDLRQQGVDVSWFNATKPTTGKGKATDNSVALNKLRTDLVGAEAKLKTAIEFNDLQAKADHTSTVNSLKAQIKRLEDLDAGDPEKKNEVTFDRTKINNAVKAGADMVRSCKDVASCANFVSGAIKSMGFDVGREPGAKKLVDKVKARNGNREVPANEAKPGMLVYVMGTGYGSEAAGDFDPKTPGRQGYHVGFYLGNGMMADSSNRSIRKAKPVPDGAKFVPVPYGMATPSDGKGYGSQNQGVKSTLPKNPPPGGTKPPATTATKPEAKKPAVKTSKQYNSSMSTAPPKPPVTSGKLPTGSKFKMK